MAFAIILGVKTGKFTQARIVANVHGMPWRWLILFAGIPVPHLSLSSTYTAVLFYWNEGYTEYHRHLPRIETCIFTDCVFVLVCKKKRQKKESTIIAVPINTAGCIPVVVQERL